MDEYLFITLAKLKADRLRLEREQRANEPAEQPLKQSVDIPRQSTRTHWFSRAPQWREQS